MHEHQSNDWEWTEGWTPRNMCLFKFWLIWGFWFDMSAFLWDCVRISEGQRDRGTAFTWEWLFSVSTLSWDLSLASLAASLTSWNFSANCKQQRDVNGQWSSASEQAARGERVSGKSQKWLAGWWLQADQPSFITHCVQLMTSRSLLHEHTHTHLQSQPKSNGSRIFLVSKRSIQHSVGCRTVYFNGLYVGVEHHPCFILVSHQTWGI